MKLVIATVPTYLPLVDLSSQDRQHHYHTTRVSVTPEPARAEVAYCIFGLLEAFLDLATNGFFLLPLLLFLPPFLSLQLMPS